MAIEIKNLFEESSPDKIFYPITSGEAVNITVDGKVIPLQQYINTLVEINTAVDTDSGTLETKFCSFPNTYTKNDVINAENVGWEDNPPTQLSAERPNLWKKYRTKFLEKESTPWIYELCGLMGPQGAQGEGPKSQTIYCVSNTQPATPTSVNIDNDVPSGWREYPQTGTNRKQWVSFRHKKDDGNWDAYSTPELWGIDIDEIKLDLQDSIADVQKEISNLIEESEKTLKGYEDRINLILSSEIPRIETEVRNAVAEANNKAAEAASYLQESKIGEVVSKVLDNPDTFGSFLGMKTGEGGGKTFTEWIQEVDKINSFVGKMEEGEDSQLKNYLSTQFTQQADELKMSAAKNSYEPYNGENSDIKDFLLTPDTIIELNPVLSYYCVYSPSTTTVYFDCDGTIEECSTGEFTFKNTKNLTISYDQSSGKIDSINLYKTLNASYGTFAVSPEKIEGILTSKDANGDSLLSKTLQTSSVITDMLSKYALKEDIPKESNLSGYVQTSELQRTYDSILQQVGKSTFKVYGRVEIQPSKSGTLYTNQPGIYKLMGGIGTVTCRINPPLDGFTNGGLYNGEDLIILESIGQPVEFNLTNTSENTVIVYLISDIKATQLASFKITSDAITSVIGNNTDLTTAIQKIAAGQAELLLSQQGKDEDGNPLEWEAAYNALVSNYESTQQQIADLNDNLLHIKQTAEGQSTMVINGYYANILSGLVNGEGWVFNQQPGVTGSIPSLKLTNPGNFTIYWNGFSGKTGTLTSPSFSLPFEAMPSTAGKTKEEIEVITEEHKNKNYYVLSWEGANPSCINSISLGGDQLLIRDTETDFKKGSADFEVVIPRYLAGYFNIVFKTTKEYKNAELIINIDITDNYSVKQPNNNIYINQIKLEKGHFGENSVRTPWTESKEDKMQITTEALTAAGKITKVEDSVSGLSSSFQQMKDSFQMTVQDEQGTIGGLTVTVNGTSFEGDVVATNFQVKPKEAKEAALIITTWGELRKLIQEDKINEYINSKSRTYADEWPIIYAKTGNEYLIFDFTGSIMDGDSQLNGYYTIKNLSFKKYEFYKIIKSEDNYYTSKVNYYLPKDSIDAVVKYENNVKTEESLGIAFKGELYNDDAGKSDGKYWEYYRLSDNDYKVYVNDQEVAAGQQVPLDEEFVNKWIQSSTEKDAMEQLGAKYGYVKYYFGKEVDLNEDEYVLLIPNTTYYNIPNNSLRSAGGYMGYPNAFASTQSYIQNTIYWLPAGSIIKGSLSLKGFIAAVQEGSQYKLLHTDIQEINSWKDTYTLSNGKYIINQGKQPYWKEALNDEDSPNIVNQEIITIYNEYMNIGLPAY